MPTIKAKKAFKEITENHCSVKSAMLKAGYAKSTASKPKNLTESKCWKELIEEYLPDNLLAKVHKEGLQAMKGKKADHYARHKYLDTAYKLKGDYAPNKLEHSGEVTNRIDYGKAIEYLKGRNRSN